MCRYVLLIFFYLFLFRNLIDGGKINKKSTKNLQVNQSTDESFKYTEPILLNSANVDLEKELNDAIDDNQSRFPDSNDNQRQVVDIENRLLEQEAAKDDAQVPSSFDNSLLHKSDDDNSDFLTLSMNSLLEIDEETNYFSLDRVTPGTIPPGITQQDYSSFDELKLIHLYQSNKSEDTKRLLNYIAQHIHNKYANCLSNFVKWILNPFSNEPIFYRNCVPCANAVDLNLQSLFNQHTNQSKLKHYFVNTCNMEKQWISYISNMEYLTVDLKQHPNTSFTDVIRQNLLPNHRFRWWIWLNICPIGLV